jgi:hypothetical protein
MSGSVRAKRTLFAAATFDIEAPSPITYLHCAREVTPEGVLEALVLEAHKEAGLQTEHLKTGDWIDCEYTSKWPHRVYVDSPEGTYVQRWIVRAIWGMSTPAPSPLRVPPPQPAIWGVFEALIYQQHLAMVRGH